MHNRTGGGTDNIDQTFTVNLSGEVANGTWACGFRTPPLLTWVYQHLDAKPGPGRSTGCASTNGTDVAIADNTTVTVHDCHQRLHRHAVDHSTAEVHIVHTYRGDLIVSLVAPDGTAYTLPTAVAGLRTMWTRRSR